MAARACQGAKGRSMKRSKKLFEEAVSVTLHSVTLDSVALCSVHGYARVHTSIYIQVGFAQTAALGGFYAKSRCRT